MKNVLLLGMIPVTKCGYGCGRDARYPPHRGKNGKKGATKWCCEDEHYKCSAIVKKNQDIAKIKRRKSIFMKDSKHVCDYCYRRWGLFYFTTVKKWCCERMPALCPAVLEVTNKRSSEANRRSQKREEHSELMKRENPMFVEEHKQKVRDITQSEKYRKDMSKKIKELWSNDEFTERFVQIMIERGNFVPHELLSEFRLYYREVYKFTQKSLREFREVINPEDKEIGRYKNNTDHIYSIFEGFKRNVNPKIIGSYINLQTVFWRENYKKHSNCGMTLEELLEKYKSLSR